MGKLLKVLGVVLIVGVLGFAGLLFWSHQKGQSVQEDFFEAVLGGDPAQVEALFHPELRKKIDRPVLLAWMAAVKEHLGAFKGLAASDFSTSVQKTADGDVTQSEGTVEFEKGEARSQLRLVDGKIVAWHVTSKALPSNWFTELKDTAHYEERAADFLRKLLAADAPGALERMHEKLRAKFEGTDVQPGLDALKARYGDVVGIKLLHAEFEAGPPQKLTLRLQVDGATDDGVGRVGFHFDGMSAFITSFDMPAD